MRLSYAKLALATVMSAMVVAPFASAYAQQKSDVRIDINMVDMDLLTATKTLCQQAGLQFAFKAGAEEFKRVTLKLNDITPEEALRYICDMAGASFSKDEAGVYIIGHSAPATVATPAAAPTVPAKRTFKHVAKLKLNVAGAQEVYEMIAFAQPFSAPRALETLKKFSNGTSMDTAKMNAVGPRLNVLNAVPLSQTFGPANVATQSTPIVGNESAKDVSLPDETANQRGGGGQGFGGQGIGGQGIGGGGLGQGGQGIGGGGLGQGGQGGAQLTGGQGMVPDGIDFISYDPNDNSLIVRGDDDAIDQLQLIVSKMDVAPKQIEIKVEFVTTTESFQKSLGYDFLYSRGAINAGTQPGFFAKSTDPVFINYSTGDIATRLRTSLSGGGGKVVTAPIVRTLNNQPATINSTVVQYIFTNTTTVSNGTVLNTVNANPIPISTNLTVAPRINNDGYVTLYLIPTLSNITGTATGPDGSEYPIFTTQAVSVVARVKNDQTIVLGGLNSKDEKSNSNKVPVLSELPIIGQFFRSVSRSKNNSELLIFVTPHVIPDEE